VRANGNPYTRVIENEFDDPDSDDPIIVTTTLFGSKFDTFELVGGWFYDSRNRAIFADRGMRHSLSLSVTAPGSGVDYYVFNYDYLQLLPIWRQWTVALSAEIGFGDALGDDTTALPPYRQFYGGGPDTVRGFQESRMGPKDNFGNPYGGNMMTVARAELIIPLPQKWQSSARVSLFHDIGNVFSTHGVEFFGDDVGLTPLTYKFKFANLRRSAGVSLEWFSVMGLFRFSYGIPLNTSKGDGPLWPDETERFQFSIGSAF
jgi:outer membrane protein insertion porin family